MHMHTANTWVSFAESESREKSVAILDSLTDVHASTLLRPTIHRHLSLFPLLTSEQQLSSRLDVAGSQGTKQGSRDNEGTDPLPLADSISTGTLTVPTQTPGSLVSSFLPLFAVSMSQSLSGLPPRVPSQGCKRMPGMTASSQNRGLSRYHDAYG